jgi:predicted O-methyltransferase YrrM
LAESLQPSLYLELGIQEGYTFNLVSRHANRSVGVDQTKRLYGGEVYVESTDSFFAAERLQKSSVDLVFIDADHSYAAVASDFANALKLLVPGGCILLHDTDPREKGLMVNHRCGDAYRFAHQLESNPNFNVVTLPVAEAGLSLVTRVEDSRVHRLL